jgi:uncharacterized protein (TIGR02145 family)
MESIPSSNFNKKNYNNLEKDNANFQDVLISSKTDFQINRLEINNNINTNIRIVLTPFKTGIVEDVDGNLYKTVVYGKKTWTVENLRATRYNDSTEIPYITEKEQWSDRTTPAYCRNRYNSEWGMLYNWQAVNTGKLAPPGWHVPSAAEWSELEDFLIRNGYNFDGTIEQNNLPKALASQSNWKTSQSYGLIGNKPELNNTSLFSAFPAGFRGMNGSYSSAGCFTSWWTSTEHNDSQAYIREMICYLRSSKRSSVDKDFGNSVRLVKD